jgi:hypothetical protein
MTRRVALALLAVLVTACAAARADTPDFSTDLAAVTAAPSGAPEVSAPTLPDEVHIETSAAISRPSDFPELQELQRLVASTSYPYPRALITSCLALTSGAEALEAQGLDTSQLDQAMKITYYDGFVLWEDDAGFRQIFSPDVGSFYQEEDGSWQEATGVEWSTFGPLHDWSTAQAEADLVLDGRPVVVGYETVAGMPTVRLLLEHGDDRAHVWIDETGATLRLVEDFGGPDGTSRWVGVWSVETLDPVLDGPMP